MPCFGKTLHPLLWFLLVLLKGVVLLAQEINIPNIISSQQGDQGSSWEPSKQEGEECSQFSGTQLGIFPLGDPKKPF